MLVYEVPDILNLTMRTGVRVGSKHRTLRQVGELRRLPLVTYPGCECASLCEQVLEPMIYTVVNRDSSLIGLAESEHGATKASKRS